MNKPGIREVLEIFGLTMLYVYCAGFFLKYLPGSWSIVVFTFGIGCLPVLFCIFDGYKISEVFNLKTPGLKEVSGGLLLSAGMFVLVLFGSSIAFRLFPGMQETEKILNKLIDTKNIFLTVFGVALFPAVCEEMLYRGFILSGLKNSVKKKAAIILCGILFGLLHLDPYRIPFTIAVGIGLSYAAWESRSLFVPIIMHAFHNLVMLLVTLKKMPAFIGTFRDFFSGPLVLLLSCGVLCLVFGVRLLKNELSFSNPV